MINRYCFKPEVLIKYRSENNRMSRDLFIKKLYVFSSGECSMSRAQLTKLELGHVKTRVNPYILAWVCRFTGISPNEMFDCKKG